MNTCDFYKISFLIIRMKRFILITIKTPKENKRENEKHTYLTSHHIKKIKQVAIKRGDGDRCQSLIQYIISSPSNIKFKT